MPLKGVVAVELWVTIFQVKIFKAAFQFETLLKPQLS